MATYKTKVLDPDGSSQQNVLYANIQKPFWLYSYQIIFSSNISSGNDEILKENIISQRYSEPCFFHCLFSNLGPVSNVVLCKMTRLKHDLDFFIADYLFNIELSDLVIMFSRSNGQWVTSSQSKENHITTRVPCSCLKRDGETTWR